MQSTYMKEIHYIYQELIRVMGDDAFSFESIIERISAIYDLPVYLKEDDLPIEMTGYTVGLRNGILICTRKGLPERRKRQVQLHEIGHILHKDIKIDKHDNNLPSYAEFTRNLNTIRCAYRLHSGSDNVELEQAIELLARLMQESIARYEASIPRTAAKLYGFRDRK